MNRISIDPITRLEGHGKIDIFLDEAGDVANTYFQVPELRGFEQFCVGRLAEEMPVITNRICGVCPEAHHMAATKALDALFGVEPPQAAHKVRELLYSAFFVTDHTTHFYALGGPDFIIGPDAPPAERNLLGVIRKVGPEIGRQVIDCRARNHHVIKTVGGRAIHPVAGLPGGWSRPITKAERDEIAAIAEKNVQFARFTLKLFDDLVLKNPQHLDLITSEAYTHRTYYLGVVDPANRVNFYDGKVRVVAPDGAELMQYHPSDYAAEIAERVEPWSYLKYPYLKRVGWNGFTDGAESGVYAASPLARLNVSDGMATPLAQEEFERFFETLGSTRVDGRYTPVHFRLATHWARLVELLYAAERMRELALDPEIVSPKLRAEPGPVTGRGIGCVEAPRGTLTHHYEADARGVLTRVNMIVGTTNNYAAMTMSVRRAAESLISKGRVEEGILNRIEMAFRLYDPCLSCATHAAVGKMPLTLRIRSASGAVIRTIVRQG
ncbi:Ni/Fe hydrogenase subunit alpha [Geomesophilobacter sediminis]|uniref:Ni/Fe hydrogenase subunit alpha n=1 Tax=Geomesophilobacter sediminis TaxID=2798584 RepID=A0A8J7J6L6_9BACT|nr:Ni/Fe hydrogenase subunit alpha [Geomesophilobacter sediminis]MBJ6724466.1 Ni/Fe hydrogenase subunit alpha [Geomesophilobacter sediminis]